MQQNSIRGLHSGTEWKLCHLREALKSSQCFPSFFFSLGRFETVPKGRTSLLYKFVKRYTFRLWGTTKLLQPGLTPAWRWSHCLTLSCYWSSLRGSRHSAVFILQTLNWTTQMSHLWEETKVVVFSSCSSPVVPRWHSSRKKPGGGDRMKWFEGGSSEAIWDLRVYYFSILEKWHLLLMSWSRHTEPAGLVFITDVEEGRKQIENTWGALLRYAFNTRGQHWVIVFK